MKVINNFLNQQNFYPKKNNQVNFGKAQVNVFATSDNHGKFESLPDMLDTVSNHRSEVFPTNDILDIERPESVKNIGVFNGDWFMDPAKGGYLTHPEKKAGDFQLKFLNKFVEQIKIPLSNFEAFNSVGNHCLDGGDKFYLGLVARQNNNFTTVLSNANLDNSPAIVHLPPLEKSKIQKARVLEIPDDKNSNLTHKALILGVTVVGVDFYNPGIVKGIDVIDRTQKKDSKIHSRDLHKTYDELNMVVQDFKKANPKGAVIIMSHTGEKISRFLAENVNDIDIIYNGHDHKDTQTVIDHSDGKQTHILSLGDDNKFFNATHLSFDDDGNFTVKYKNIKTEKYSESHNNAIGRLIRESFAQDQKPYFEIEGEDGDLSQKNIRKDNNQLANLVTDGIMSSIRKYDPDVQVFGLASSAFRQDLNIGKKGNNNLVLRNLLSGQTDDLSVVHVASVKGSDLVSMVVENIEDHKKDMERNTIVQWSGVQINKTGIIDTIEAGQAKQPENLVPYINIKNQDGEYEPINPEQTYKTAIPNYFFKRPKLPTAQKLEGDFVSMNKTLDELFREHLKDNKLKVALPDSDDKRII